MVLIGLHGTGFNLARIVAVTTTAPTTATTAASRLAFALGLTKLGTCDGNASRRARLGAAGFGSCFLDRFGTARFMFATRAVSASVRARLAAAFARGQTFVALNLLLGAASDQGLWCRVLIRGRALRPIAAPATVGSLAAIRALRAIAALASIVPNFGSGAIALGLLPFGSLTSIATPAAFSTAPATSAARTSVAAIAAIATRFTSRTRWQRRRHGTLGCCCSHVR